MFIGVVFQRFEAVCDFVVVKLETVSKAECYNIDAHQHQHEFERPTNPLWVQSPYRDHQRTVYEVKRVAIRGYMVSRYLNQLWYTNRMEF